MPRLLSTLLVVALLAGTAAAFAVTQGLKIAPSPIRSTRVTKVFSPTCDCPTRVADIQFRLRKADRVRVQIVDADGEVVRTLVPGTRLRRGTVHYTWDGRDEAGRLVPQGVYEPRVHLPREHRTIQLPNQIRVDTTAPRITVLSIKPLVFSPDGDGRSDRVTIAYTTSEPAHAILMVDGARATFTRRQLQRSSVVWNGKVHHRLVAPGVHRVWLAAQDPAGNVSNGKVYRVTVRYLQLAHPVVRAKAGTRFGVGVSADGTVHWRLHGRSGTAKPGVLVLRAPRKSGSYPLVVRVASHEATATLIVSKR